MRRPLRIFALAVALPALLLPGTAGAADSSVRDRLYLLSSDDDYLYWSADPLDPELGVGSTSRICGNGLYGIPGRSKPCLTGVDLTNGSRLYSLFFMPGSLLGENVTWSSTEPLKFHIEGAVNTFGAPYTLHLALQKDTENVESVPATQTSPGVWEGELPAGAPLSPSRINFLTVRVRTQAPAAIIDLELGGASYVELPRPFAVRTVPDLLREDVYRPAPTSYSSETRSFSFNDANWSSRTFTGTTGPLREFSFQLDQRSEILFVWVELFDSAFVQDVRSGRQPDPEKVRQGASVRLFRDGVKLDHSGTGNGGGGFGTEALAVPDVAPGPLTLQVDSANEDTPNRPFTVHVVEIRGERTLGMMRWTFLRPTSLRMPMTGLCPAASEPVPATDEVRSLALDLDWKSEAPGIPRFTPSYSLPDVGGFPCGEAGTGDEVRLNIPREHIWYVGATPSHDSLHVSVHDTSFEITARYTYSAPPAA